MLAEDKDSVAILELCLELRRVGMRVDQRSDMMDTLRQLLLCFDCTGDRKASAALKALLDNVVYIVLNHSPLATDEAARRHFVAALFWENVDPRVQKWLTHNRTATDSSALPDACDMILISDALVPPTVKKRAGILWARKWHEYWNVTLRGQQKGYYTWNQFLLHQARQPEPLGLTWNGTKDPDRLHYGEFHSDCLQELGLPHPGDDKWLENLLALDESAGEHCLSSCDCHRLDDHLTGVWEEVAGRADAFPKGAIGWAAFHLLRSYAIWGGTAFMSIPVVFGAKAPNRTAVLSLCTKEPLKQADLAIWWLVSELIFQPLMDEEMMHMVKERDVALRDATRQRLVAAMAYGIGHPLKHRIVPVRAAITELSDLVDATAPPEILKHSFRCALAKTRRVAALGSVLDCISRAILKGTHASVFGDPATPHWRVNSPPYMVALGLSDLAGATLVPDPQERIEHVRFEVEDDAALAVIENWISSPSPHRPANMFYDEILAEVILNCARHGLPDAQGSVPVKVHVMGGTAESMLVFSNPCRRKQDPLALKLQCEEWCDWHTDGADAPSGGLFFVAMFLTTTGCGALRARLKTKPDGQPATFSVGLRLRGLRLADE